VWFRYWLIGLVVRAVCPRILLNHYQALDHMAKHDDNVNTMFSWSVRRVFGTARASLLALSLIACGSTSLPPAPQTSAAQATGRTSVLVVDGPGSPLVVDWKAEQRADLEVKRASQRVIATSQEMAQ
jgi:hypothetical protein